ncbi:D-2-hydroxyacid dehydrogenase [Candidatus Formimonas warabiya]|uniref:3-phosphoglycerate dehydrogenase n=1 Tax=Formimonas warabiya TaxID=1761012 RepID=A0A3G1KM96_FORW1|nr:D-2-hydroxyacid dehydrogenase [Candidatus Formimonas warabiya]ATW23572.1 3-phosphoglycerate dehydrogenase [Candidatus Formimonas warabiya]
MKRILITDGLEQDAVAQLRDNGFEVVEQFYPEEELKEEIKKYDAVVVRSATKIRKPVIDAALETGRLQLIIRGGVGTDNIDVAYANEKGIAVKNTPNASSASVAELVIGHMFNIARFIHASNYSMRLGQWNKKAYEGIELAGKTLGLIGFGRIAKETAKKADALGMKVVYTDLLGPDPNYPQYQYLPMEELMQVADFISVHVPGSKDKTPLIGEKEFNKMKDGVYVINAARGGVVCEEALLSALDSGKVAAAALDVYQEEPTKNEKICTHERISLTPHLGASTNEAQQRVGKEVVQIITNHFSCK